MPWLGAGDRVGRLASSSNSAPESTTWKQKAPKCSTGGRERARPGPRDADHLGGARPGNGIGVRPRRLRRPRPPAGRVGRADRCRVALVGRRGIGPADGRAGRAPRGLEAARRRRPVLPRAQRLSTTWPEHRRALPSGTSSGPWERAQRERAAVDEQPVWAPTYGPTWRPLPPSRRPRVPRTRTSKSNVLTLRHDSWLRQLQYRA